MPLSVLYLGEQSGARIIASGGATTQIGTDFQASFTTWDLTPAGETGDCLFRTIDVTGYAASGWALGVIPIVDGVDLAEQFFSGSGTGEFEAQAFIATRGARVAARVRTTSRTGTVEIHNVATAFVPLRAVP